MHRLQLGYRDKAWSVNRLGAVARRHGYGEACLRIINSLYGFNAMEVQEAFIKIREQVRWGGCYHFHAAMSPSQHSATTLLDISSLHKWSLLSSRTIVLLSNNRPL